MITFEWTEPFGIADGQQCCEVGPLILWATPDGEWRVCKKAGKMALVIVSDCQQTKGKDINEAKQRAQGAALVQLQLLG
jgi:hypothetical protein